MNDADIIYSRRGDVAAASHAEAGDRTPGGKKRLGSVRMVLCISAGLVVLGIASLGFYQFPAFAEMFAQAAANKKAAPQATVPAEQNKPASVSAASDLFTSQAMKAGAMRCAATYGVLGKALTGGAAFMVQTEIAKVDADRHALQGVVGMTFRSDSGQYSGPAAGLVFAAPTPGGCEGTIIRSVPFPQECQAVAPLLPKGSMPLQQLSGISLYALSSGGQVMLIPAVSGCVAMTIARSGG